MTKKELVAKSLFLKPEQLVPGGDWFALGHLALDDLKEQGEAAKTATIERAKQDYVWYGGDPATIQLFRDWEPDSLYPETVIRVVFKGTRLQDPNWGNEEIK
jgi:hypothetical protein